MTVSPPHEPDSPDGRFPREELVARPEVVAPHLLGALLSSGTPGSSDEVLLRVVEVEAYAGVGEDPGSHAHRGPRRRNATMFGEPGHLYVYFTYGMHWCVNVVAHERGAAGAVLLRAAEVLHGEDVARARRTTSRRPRDLAMGPARLAVAAGLDGKHDGADLCAGGSPVRLLAGAPPAAVGSGPRVGVSGDGAVVPWRWWDANSPAVSAYRAAVVRRPRAADGTGAGGRQ